jgi:hypothetical protein
MQYLHSSSSVHSQFICKPPSVHSSFICKQPSVHSSFICKPPPMCSVPFYFILPTFYKISLMASVNLGKTSSSLKNGRQAMGPSFLYLSKNILTVRNWTISFPPPCCVFIRFSILNTVSGDKSPWAVGKDGRVSDELRTEFERGGKVEFSVEDDGLVCHFGNVGLRLDLCEE